MMTRYFVVQTYQGGGRKGLQADPPIQAQSEDQAKRTAARYALSKAGVIAFSRAVDPTTGDAEDAKILYAHGQVPSEDV